MAKVYRPTPAALAAYSHRNRENVISGNIYSNNRQAAQRRTELAAEVVHAKRMEKLVATRMTDDGALRALR